MSADSISLHAIYVVLDDAALFRASIASIYDEVDGITVITNHDRDWRGRRRDPTGITAMVLSRDVDPERKVDLIVASETNEARARGRAMDFAAPRRRTLRVRREHEHDHRHRSPDYFLIIDADEIYGGGALTRLKAYVSRHRHPLYRVPCVRYFKRWNYAVDGLEWAISVVRADRRLPYLRMRRRASLIRRGAARVPGMPNELQGHLRGFWDVPFEVAHFHHGSYVGPRQRIEQKLASFGHSEEIPADWLTRVYDPWTLDSVDFNPAYPGLFPSARRLTTAELPAEIRDRSWPPGYLEEIPPIGETRAEASKGLSRG